MTTVFKTERYFPGMIRRYEVLELTPKSVTTRKGCRERKETIYHRYHETFGRAKQFAIAELEINLRGAQTRVDFLQSKLDKLRVLTEADLL